MNIAFYSMFLALLASGGGNEIDHVKQKDIVFNEEVVFKLAVKEYSQEDLFTLNAMKEYKLFYNDEDYFVVKLKTGEIVEEGAQNPYLMDESQRVFVFNESGNRTKHITFNNDSYWFDRNKDESINFNSTNGASLSSFNSVQKSLDWDEINSNSFKKIENYKYFLKLNGRHGLNESSVCTLTAIEMLCGYYDSFIDDDIVGEKWDYPSYYSGSRLGFNGSWECWPNSSETGLQYDNDDFGRCKNNEMRDFLIEDCKKEVNPFVEQTGNSSTQQERCLKRYLDQTKIKYTVNSFQSLNASQGYLVKNRIINAINSNNPIITNGHHHSVIAFGYNDKDVLINNGWGYCALVPWETFTTDTETFYCPSCIEVKLNCYHSHSDNYYSPITGRFYCTCGYYFDGGKATISTLENGTKNITLNTGNVFIQTANNISLENGKKGKEQLCLNGLTDGSGIEFKSQKRGIKALCFRAYETHSSNWSPSYYVYYQDASNNWHDALWIWNDTTIGNKDYLQDYDDVVVTLNFPRGTSAAKIYAIGFKQL